jgi:ectoine hydroxylase-related dioxygenase (phytanoyl-CoA dioxygenase family)
VTRIRREGCLWDWPGSHREAATYFKEHGPEALKSCIPYPPIHLSKPRQVTARAGDVMFAHYMLGHNMGGNVSDLVREVLYFRLRRAGHRQHWQETVQDPFLEFEPVRCVWTANDWFTAPQ